MPLVSQDWHMLLLFLTIVIWWAMLRPSGIKDDDGRRLPDKPISRVVYALICVTIYLALVACFVILPGPLNSLGHALPYVSGFFDNLAGDKPVVQAPVLAALLMAALIQFPLIKDIERSILIRLHSASNLSRDSEELSNHLRRCEFTPSAAEQAKNVEMAKKFGVYVEDAGFDANVPLPIENWRKVATLTRLIKEWNAVDARRVLTNEQMAELEQVIKAHERKTGVVLEIVKLIEQVEQGAMSPEALLQSIQMLHDTPNIDRDSITEAEDKVRKLIEKGAGAAIKRPLRISSTALKRDLARIGSYFQEEYELLLSQVTALASKSVILSGTAAPARLDTLKAVGFGGLGRIEPISLDRVLAIIFGVSFLGFLIMFVGNRNTNMTPDMAERLARFAFIMAIAALIGSLVGSRRRHASAEETPWGIYFMAGLLAGAVMIAVNGITFVIQSTQHIEQPPFVLNRLLPWTLLPFFVTVTICWLGRREYWQVSQGITTGQRVLIERVVDGVAVSLALLVGMYGAVALLELLREPLPPGIIAAMKATDGHRIMPIPILWPLQVLGFLIGFMTVRDVRRGAHNHMIDEAAAATAGKRDPAVTQNPMIGGYQPPPAVSDPGAGPPVLH